MPVLIQLAFESLRCAGDATLRCRVGATRRDPGLRGDFGGSREGV